MFVRLTSRRARNAVPQELTGLQFYNQRKSVGVGGKGLLSLSWVDIMFLSSVPPPGQAGKFTCPCIVRPGLSYSTLEKYFQFTVRWGFFNFEKSPFHKWLLSVCTEPVLGIINLLSSLGRMWVSRHLCFIVWGHVPCFCCMGLLLSKPVWFCG